MDAKKLGKYEVRGTLGRGAMGLVYEGWDPAIARRVAIKTVRLPDTTDTEAAEMLARFKREAQAAGRLNHPNIVGVFDYGETDEVAFIVMEFIDGRSLKAILEKRELLPPTEIARVMTSLLAGLQYSHDNGVVHRDIKPANIMLTIAGQVKIADFGIARIESSSMTQTGAVLGTPAYMSPEQFMGEGVDRRTDIYSSGVVLYQMLTGERPFDGGMSSIMHKALNTVPPRPSDLSVVAPPAFDAVVAKAMAKRPENRFDTADAFALALRKAMDAAAAGIGDDDATRVAMRAPKPAAPAVAAPVRTKTPTTETAKARKSLAPVIAFGGVVVLAAVGASAWYMLPLRTTEQTVARLETPPPALPAPPSSRVDAPAVEPPLPASPPLSVAPPPAPSPPAPPPVAASITPPPPPPAAAAPAEAAIAKPAPLLEPPSLPPPPRIETPLASPPAVEPSATTSAPQDTAPAPPPAPPKELASISPAPVPALPAPAPAPPPSFDFTGARSLARGVPCALLDVRERATPQGIVPAELFGPALPGAEFDAFLRQLRGQFGSMQINTQPLASGHCAAVSALGELVRQTREQGRALRIIAPDAPVTVGGRFKIGATVERDMVLYVDLYEADGWVHHVLHRGLAGGGIGDVEDMTAVEAPGQYLVVAIAAPTSLVTAQRSPRERGETYLPVLKRELARIASMSAGLVRAEITVLTALARQPATPSPRPPPAVAAIPRAPSLNASRCADIVARAQLGEGLSDADRAALRTSCRP